MSKNVDAKIDALKPKQKKRVAKRAREIAQELPVGMKVVKAEEASPWWADVTTMANAIIDAANAFVAANAGSGKTFGYGKTQFAAMLMVMVSFIEHSVKNHAAPEEIGVLSVVLKNYLIAMSDLPIDRVEFVTYPNPGETVQ